MLKKKKLFPNFSKKRRRRKSEKISHNDKIDLLGKKGEKKCFASPKLIIFMKKSHLVQSTKNLI